MPIFLFHATNIQYIFDLRKHGYEKVVHLSYALLYCCPVKLDKHIKVSLNRCIYAAEISFFKIQAQHLTLFRLSR